MFLFQIKISILVTKNSRIGTGVQKRQKTMNPNNKKLTDVNTLQNSWKKVSSKQSVCAFYMERDEELGFLSNFAKHEAFDYFVPFGSFAGEIVPVNFSEKAIMLNKVH